MILNNTFFVFILFGIYLLFIISYLFKNRHQIDNIYSHNLPLLNDTNIEPIIETIIEPIIEPIIEHIIEPIYFDININNFHHFIKSNHECVICLNSIDINQSKNNNIIICTICYNTFHSVCLYEWLTKKYICPICDNKKYYFIYYNILNWYRPRFNSI